jgi:hypothetical protein
VSNDAIFANLNIIANFECADDAIFIDVNIVTDGHLGIFESPLLLHETRPDYALLSNNCKSSNRNSRKVTSEDCSCLDNGFALDHYFFRTFDKNLSGNFVALGGDKKPVFIIIQGVLLDHHYYI